MTVDLIIANENSGDYARPGLIRSTWAAIAADDNVHALWLADAAFVDEDDFAWRDAKNGRDYILRPSEWGYQPSLQTFGTTGANFLRFGQGTNPGPAGGTLDDTNNGALQASNAAGVFPAQDTASASTIQRPYAIVTAFNCPATADDGGAYPGVFAGCACRFPDSTSVTQTDWAGLGLGFGASSNYKVFGAWRGTATGGYAADTSNRVDGNWHVAAFLFCPDSSVGKLRINGTQVASVSMSQNHTIRTGQEQLRVGAAGDLGEAFARTLIGDLGSIAILHADCSSGAGLTSLEAIEDALIADFDI